MRLDFSVPNSAHAGRLEHRHEAAEVGGELLDAGADRDEVVIAAGVEQLLLDERFLRCRDGVEPRVLTADVGVDAVELRQVDEVQAEGGRDAHAPVDGTERRVAAEEIERCAQRRDRQEDAAAAEEPLAPGSCVLTPLGTGRLRPSSSESLTPVNTKNVRLPKTG